MSQPTSLGSQPCQPNQPSPGCENRRGFPEERETNCTANSEWLDNARRTTTRRTAHATKRKTARKSSRKTSPATSRETCRQLMEAHVRLIRVLRTGYPAQVGMGHVPCLPPISIYLYTLK